MPATSMRRKGYETALTSKGMPGRRRKVGGSIDRFGLVFRMVSRSPTWTSSAWRMGWLMGEGG